jgi:SAM-dependent methyltransferase
MIVCADCRSALHDDKSQCSNCGWRPIVRRHFVDFLSTRDRTDEETATYIDVYDTLAERNLVQPVESNDYVESLALGCAEQLGRVSGKDVCDVGSGRGFFVRHMIARGARSITAVDIAAPALGALADRYGVRAFLANAENLPFEREFDILVATDIVEHVLNVSNFLVTANWALRDNGVLVARVPYLEDMLSYSNFFGLPMHFTHLRTFDKKVITHVIETAGFKVESVFYDGFRYDYLSKVWDSWPWARRWIRGWIVRRYGTGNVRGLNQHIARILMKPIEIGVVARKVEHLEIRNYHDDLRRYYEQTKQGRGRLPRFSAGPGMEK